MSFTSRTTTSLQAYHTLLYRVPLHPEFFRIEAREKSSHTNYGFESRFSRVGMHFDSSSMT